MTDLREKQIIEFLSKNNLGDAKRDKLPSDASFRTYQRIYNKDKTLILMDAPSPENEKIGAFANIGNYLRQRGLSAPEIIDYDETGGFMLLEDLGADSFTKILAGDNKFSEKELYIAAIETLIQLDRSTLPANTPPYDEALLMREVKLLTEWYLPNIAFSGDRKAATEEYEEIWREILNFKDVSEGVLVLRDYHADNLMWLSDRNGVQNVGLLDFQDAVIGSPVYDIVSLLEDARRDVKKETVDACIEYYLNARKSIDADDFKRVYAILGAQRNCKIVGIFTRLALRDNKPRYLDYLSRVWGHVNHDLEHPCLAKLKVWMDECIPQQYRTKDAVQTSNKEYAVG